MLQIAGENCLTFKYKIVSTGKPKTVIKTGNNTIIMTTITISAFSESGWVKVFIDGNEVLSAAGSTAVSLNEGIHFLTYFVQGLPGNHYQIGITDPPEDIWDVKGKLKLNHTTGQHGITI